MNDDIKIVLDAGTTWSKIIEKSSSNLMAGYNDFLVDKDETKNYYIIPSSKLKDINFKFDIKLNSIEL